MLPIRPVEPRDLDFLAWADLLNDGYTPSANEQPMTPADLVEQRAKIAGFVTGFDQAGWVVEDPPAEQPVAMILARFRNHLTEPDTPANAFLLRFLDKTLFPPDGRFCEIFNLWVAPAYRRQHLATRLKLVVEEEARRRGLRMIYTHTEAANTHVIELNLKLGYRIIRVGPIWDEIPRTSLVKDLTD